MSASFMGTALGVEPILTVPCGNNITTISSYAMSAADDWSNTQITTLKANRVSTDFAEVKNLKNLDFTGKDLFSTSTKVEHKKLVNIKPSDIKGLMTEFYKPMLCKLLRFDNICLSCEREVFIRKFKMNNHTTTAIMEVIDGLYGQGLNFILAGGKMVNWFAGVDTIESDFDLFFSSDHDFESVNQYFKKNDNYTGTEKEHLIEYCQKDTGLRFQIMKKIYACPEDLISQFDFKHSSIAYDGSQIYWHKGTLHAIRDKVLIFQILPDKINQFLRVEKFIKRGWSIQLGDWALASFGLLTNIGYLYRVHNQFINREDFEFNADHYQ